MNGLSNVTYVPLGFDTDFHLTNRSYLPEKIHFGLMGKFENRKNSSRIIKTWLKLFGNKSDFESFLLLHSSSFLTIESFVETSYTEYIRTVENEADMLVAEVLEIKDNRIIASRVYHG